jgi:L-lactate dehydrogenase complex protein LldG
MTDFAKKNILNRLQQALKNTISEPFPNIKNHNDVFVNQRIKYLEIEFAEQFKAVGGQFVFCENTDQFADYLLQLFALKKWKKIVCWEHFLQDFLHQIHIDFDNQPEIALSAEVALTSCRALVARTGSIVVDSWQNKGRGISIVPPIHIVVARQHQIVANLSDILPDATLQNNQFPSVWSLITGASRTADIEKTLVMGAHGPKEIFVFLVD